MTKKHVPIISKRGIEGNFEYTLDKFRALQDGDEIIMENTGNLGLPAMSRCKFDKATSRFLADESTTPSRQPVTLTRDDEKMIKLFNVTREDFLARKQHDADQRAELAAEVAHEATPQPVTQVEVTLTAADERMIRSYGIKREDFIARKRAMLEEAAYIESLV